jgi:nucleoside-specific outer membrane channel protein Tsx
MSRTPPGIATAVLCCACLAWQPAAAAADWSATSAWFLHGDNFELGAPDRDILRLEHADAWKYGDNYFFVDLIDSGDDDTTFYAEFAPRVSLGKISGHDLGFGPVTDILLAGGINAGEDFRAYLYGLGVDLKLPGFGYFQLNAYARDDKNLPGSSWQLTPVWLYPFTIGGLKFEFQGFIDFIGGEGPTKFNYVAAPRLWLDLGALWGAPGRLQMGFEYLYWENKYGVDGVNESVFQPALRWTF